MKKLNKVLSATMVVLMLVCISTNVFAKTVQGSLSLDDIKNNTKMNTQAAATMGQIGGNIIQLVTNVGMILSVVVIAILGVKYMMGSTEEKAEYKKAMVPYLVGAVLIFGASTVAKFVSNFAKI